MNLKSPFLCAFVLAWAGQQMLFATDKLRITVGPEFLVDDGGGKTRQFPFLEYLDGILFATFSQHHDSYVDHPVDGMRISEDGGLTWATHVEKPDFYLTSIVKLPDGRLLGMSYITYWMDARQASCHYWISSNRGRNWEPHTGVVKMPQDMAKVHKNWGGMLFHRAMLVMPDGSLQGPMYGMYAGDAKYRVIWVKSVDQGANWSVVSTVAYNPKYEGWEGFGEPCVVKAADGSLLMVMRVQSFFPLYQCRSTDGGLTWSTPTMLPGVASEDTHSVDPDLTLMTNGTLVLSYGRPKTRMLFSLDGSGYGWGNLTDTFHTGSGYTGVREVSPDRLLLITENSPHKRVKESWVNLNDRGGVRGTARVGGQKKSYINLNSAELMIVGKFIEVLRTAPGAEDRKP